jgi:hypothetical protein
LQVVEVLNPLARDYKSIGTMKKELAELQDELAQAHRQVWKLSSIITDGKCTPVETKITTH